MTRQHGLAAVHGRFQPFHNGHFEYLTLALELAHQVIVGITNPLQVGGNSSGREEATDSHRHQASSNPFTYFERLCMISAAVADISPQLLARISIVPFEVTQDAYSWPQVIPITAVQLVTIHEPWDAEKASRFRCRGYQVATLPPKENRVTATRVRQLLGDNDPLWTQLVPGGVVDTIRRLGLDVRLQRERVT